MQTKKKIYYWACDISENSGEGILANSFIKNYLQNNKNTNFENLNYKDKYQKKKFINIKKLRYETIFHKYIYPFIGVVRLWSKFLNNKKTCYINYLPLWNFLIFLLLPPRTIIGPITGTILRKKIYSIIFYFFEIISLCIIKLRHEKVFFSHNFYIIKYRLNKKHFIGNFIFKDFFYRKKNKNKKYDFIVYFRKGEKLYQNYIFKIIKKMNSLNYKFAIIGDKINLKGSKNFGYISRKKANKIISQSKFAIANPENLYSYFVQDCLSNHLIVFYNILFKNYNSLNLKNLTPITFKNTKKDIKIIKKKIK